MKRFIVCVKLFWTFIEYEYDNITDARKKLVIACEAAQRDAQHGDCHPCVTLVERTKNNNGTTIDTIRFERYY